MKTKTGMSIGLALTLMVGVFATMLALGLFTNNPVQAQTAVTGVMLSHSSDDTGAFTQVTVKFVATNGVDFDDTITIEFSGDDNTGATGVILLNNFDPEDTTVNNVATTTATRISGQRGLIVTVPDIDGDATNTEEVADGDMVTVVFKMAMGVDGMVDGNIRNPLTAQSVTVDVMTLNDVTALMSGTVSIKSYVQGVNVTHVPDGTNAAAKITVRFTTDSTLNPAESIMIEFEDDIQVPEVINASHVTINAENTANGDTGTGQSGVANPSGVTVQRVGNPADEPLVTLDIGDMLSGDTATVSAGLQGIPNATVVTVTFSQSAGIRNPTEGGSSAVKVSTTNDPTGVTSNKFGFPRVIVLSSSSGERGATVTVTGKGFKNSTDATVWIDADKSNTIGSAEAELCTAPIAGTDIFTCSFVVNASNFDPNEKGYINAVDGRNQWAAKPAEWTLKGKVTAVPDSAAIGDTVTVEVRDFPKGTTGKLTLGGETIFDNIPDEDDPDKVLVNPPNDFVLDAEGNASFTIRIPDEVALGRQALTLVWGKSGSRRDTMTILGAQLEIAPSTVVPNQSITVTGRGYTSNGSLNDPSDDTGDAENLSQILLGGTRIDWDKIEGGDDISIDSGGSWVATIVIPVMSPATVPGTYELKAIDNAGRPGAAQVVISSRTVDFDPKESRVGTTVTVSGSGWVASNSASGAVTSSINVEYFRAGQDDVEASARATPDSDGNFSATIKVPLNASIPSTNKVSVYYEDEDDQNISETVAHRVPGAGMEISPTSGPGGTRGNHHRRRFQGLYDLDQAGSWWTAGRPQALRSHCGSGRRP